MTISEAQITSCTKNSAIHVNCVNEEAFVKTPR